MCFKRRKTGQGLGVALLVLTCAIDCGKGNGSAIQNNAKDQTSNATALTAGAKWRLRDSYFVKPFNCHDPWLAGSSNVILTVENWAEEAGIQTGDRLVRIGEHDLTASLKWDDAMRLVPKGTTFTVVTRRRGQLHSVVLECRDPEPYIKAERQVFEAMSARKWRECIGAADRAMEIFGSKTTPLLEAQVSCFEQTEPNPKAERLASLLYEQALTGVDEMRSMESAERTEARTSIVSVIGKLDQQGFGAFAADLRNRLAAADEARERDLNREPDDPLHRPRK